MLPSTSSLTLNLTTATGPLPVIPLMSMIPVQSRPGDGELESIRACSDNSPRSTWSSSTLAGSYTSTNSRLPTLSARVANIGTDINLADGAIVAFGAPVVWAHPEISPGRTTSATLDLEIPSLYTEAYGGGHVRFEDVECYTRGLANLLKFLDITALEQSGLPQGYNPRFLKGSGDMDVAIKCKKGGMFFRSVEVGDNVQANDVLGIVRSLEGRIEEKIVASQDSVVMLVRATPRIYPCLLYTSDAADE